eukprot:scaffold368_cov137-Skeletonema_marinoi.AAC.12
MKPEQRTIDLGGTCTLDHRRSYADMVEHFESIFAKDAVAIIPSAFILGNANSGTKNFEQNVFRDDADHSEYDEYRFICSENKTEVLDMIRRGHLAMIEKNEATANSTPAVFFASNSQEALSCYKQFLSDDKKKIAHENSCLLSKHPRHNLSYSRSDFGFLGATGCAAE